MAADWLGRKQVRFVDGPAVGRETTTAATCYRINVPVLDDLGLRAVMYEPTGLRAADGLELWATAQAEPDGWVH